jgi:hypothetical protein
LFDQFRNTVAESPTSSLLEVGSRARSGNTYRQLFPASCRYLGTDITDGPNVDLVADAHTLDGIDDETFHFAFSISVFEHLMMPWLPAER